MKLLFLGTSLFIPLFVLAAPPRNFKELVAIILDVVDILILFIFALTVVVLLWGVMKAWILNAGDANAIESGKRIVLIGVVVLAVMSGIWGILYILRYSLFGI